MKNNYVEIIKKSENEVITKEEALFLFKASEDKNNVKMLFETAVKVREKEIGNVFRWTAGIARVLRCHLKPLCTYCPYWRKGMELQPLSIEEILKGVNYISRHGIKEFHLSGGTTLGSDGQDILEIVEAIREAGYDDLEIDINCGAAMSVETLKRLKVLGVTKVGSVFETVNRDWFKKVKPGDDFEQKDQFAKSIGQAGLGLTTGLMAGLGPIETKYEDYVDFMFHVKKYKHLKSVYISKFYPFEGILLKDHPECPTSEALRVMAIMRLILRNVDINPAAGWKATDFPTPLMAGGGNKVLGIHINRTPHYSVGKNPYCNNEKNIEYCNKMEVVKKNYENNGIKII